MALRCTLVLNKSAKEKARKISVLLTLFKYRREYCSVTLRRASPSSGLGQSCPNEACESLSPLRHDEKNTTRKGSALSWRRGEDTSPLRYDGKAEPKFSVHTPYQPNKKRVPFRHSFFIWRRGEDSNLR